MRKAIILAVEVLLFAGVAFGQAPTQFMGHHLGETRAQFAAIEHATSIKQCAFDDQASLCSDTQASYVVHKVLGTLLVSFSWNDKLVLDRISIAPLRPPADDEDDNAPFLEQLQFLIEKYGRPPGIGYQDKLHEVKWVFPDAVLTAKEIALKEHRITFVITLAPPPKPAKSAANPY
jgi:hypothetical protein